MTLKNQLKGAVSLILALGVLPFVLAAQARPQASPSPSRQVMLVERATLPQGHRAMVFRRASGPVSRDIIALTPTATGSDLSAAIALLDGLHARYGDRPERDIAVAISDTLDAIKTDAARAKRHASFVRQLRDVQPAHVEGFGMVRAVQIHVRARRATIEPARSP